MPRTPTIQEKMATQAEGTTWTRPQCSSCRHWLPESDSCPAFPEPGSIPLVVKLNRFNHGESVWPGQVGETRWEAKV